MNIDRIREALIDILSCSWDYYDGQNVWCRFCWATRPSPDVNDKLDWHENNCLYRIAHEEKLVPDDPTPSSVVEAEKRFKKIR